MPIELKVPEMGEAVSEVYIGQWQKKEGERVEQDDALVELESDKATLDLRAPSGGVLAKILKKTGEAAEVGEVIAHLDGAEQKQPVEKTEQKPQKDEAKARDAGKESLPAEPAAKEVSREKQEATDVAEREPAVKKHEVPQSRAAPPAVEREAAAPQKADDEERARPPRTKPEPSRGEERTTMSPIRRRIAARLVEAQQVAALLTTFNEIDMSAVKELRSEHGEAFEKRHQVRLGFMSFFVKAAIEALRQCPELNAVIDGDDIIYRQYYDIGVAISTDKGLVVPVLRDAERMSFAEIEQAINELAKRARGGDLKVEELQGGTFTITNGGVFGSLLSTPIVNPPQSGVLGMHAIQDRPVAIGGDVVVRPMMYVALTYDHRIVDGREAVTFLRRIKETIEQPARLLLEA